MKRKKTLFSKNVKRQMFKRIRLSFLLLLFLIFVGLLAAYYFLESGDREILVESLESQGKAEVPVRVGVPGSAHHHASFLIFINGKMVRFDDLRYYEASPYVHLHESSFAEIHTHAENVTLGFFFETVGIFFNKNCLVFDGNVSYCNNVTHTLKFYVNGSLSDDYGDHFTSDWERYLITYGDQSAEEILEQIEKVPDPKSSFVPEGNRGVNVVLVNRDRL